MGPGFGHFFSIKDRNQLCGIANRSDNKWHIYNEMNLVSSVILPRSYYSLHSNLQLMSVQMNIVFCFYHLKMILPPSALSHSVFHSEVF